MYALKLPPDLVTRLYRLREDHNLGPIRRQVLTAVETYLADAEAQRGISPTVNEVSAAPASPARREPS